MTLTVLRQLIAKKADDGAVGRFLSLALSRFTDIYNAMCRWENTKTQIRNLFTRQALSIVWDPAEANPLAGQAGDFTTTLKTMVRVVEAAAKTGVGQTQIADATDDLLPDEVAAIWFTDPPYYDAIPYADLSDFFLVG